MRWPRVRLTVRMTIVLVLIFGVGLGWAVRQAPSARRHCTARSPAHGKVAIAEVRHHGRLELVTAGGPTHDDAIRLIIDRLAKEGIDGSSVMRVYSEQQPSHEWGRYFKAHWPNAAVTWSSKPDEDAEMKSALDRVLHRTTKPWWMFW